MPWATSARSLLAHGAQQGGCNEFINRNTRNCTNCAHIPITRSVSRCTQTSTPFCDESYPLPAKGRTADAIRKINYNRTILLHVLRAAIAFHSSSSDRSIERSCPLPISQVPPCHLLMRSFRGCTIYGPLRYLETSIDLDRDRGARWWIEEKNRTYSAKL